MAVLLLRRARFRKVDRAVPARYAWNENRDGDIAIHLSAA